MTIPESSDFMVPQYDASTVPYTSTGLCCLGLDTQQSASSSLNTSGSTWWLPPFTNCSVLVMSVTALLVDVVVVAGAGEIGASSQISIASLKHTHQNSVTLPK